MQLCISGMQIVGCGLLSSFRGEADENDLMAVIILMEANLDGFYLVFSGSPKDSLDTRCAVFPVVPLIKIPSPFS